NLGRRLAQPLAHGRLGRLYRLCLVCGGLLAPLARQSRGLLRGATPTRIETPVASLCVLVGGYLLRYVMVMAGRASADDPQATFALTRRLCPLGTPAFAGDQEA